MRFGLILDALQSLGIKSSRVPIPAARTSRRAQLSWIDVFPALQFGQS